MIKHVLQRRTDTINHILEDSVMKPGSPENKVISINKKILGNEKHLLFKNLDRYYQCKSFVSIHPYQNKSPVEMALALRSLIHDTFGGDKCFMMSDKITALRHDVEFIYTDYTPIAQDIIQDTVTGVRVVFVANQAKTSDPTQTKHEERKYFYVKQQKLDNGDINFQIWV